MADGIMVLAERVAELEMQAQTFASHDFVIQLAERLDKIELLLEDCQTSFSSFSIGAVVQGTVRGSRPWKWLTRLSIVSHASHPAFMNC